MGKIVRVKASELKSHSKKRMAELSKRSIIIDEENPEITDEDIANLRKVHANNIASNKRVAFSARIPQRSFDKLKSFGPGYSRIVANMIEYCLKDPEIIKKCL